MNSRHASMRAQQRAIPPLVIDWLLHYGAEAPDKNGAAIRYFDKRAIRSLEHHVGRECVRRMKDKLSSYLVEAEGRVITVGYRRRRIRK